MRELTLHPLLQGRRFRVTEDPYLQKKSVRRGRSVGNIFVPEKYGIFAH